MCHCHSFPERFSPKLTHSLSRETQNCTTVVTSTRPGTRVGAELETWRCGAQHQVHTQHKCWRVNESPELFSFLTDTERQVDANAAEFASPRVRVGAIRTKKRATVQWRQSVASRQHCANSTTFEEEMCLKVLSQLCQKSFSLEKNLSSFCKSNA